MMLQTTDLKVGMTISFLYNGKRVKGKITNKISCGQTFELNNAIKYEYCRMSKIMIEM